MTPRHRFETSNSSVASLHQSSNKRELTKLRAVDPAHLPQPAREVGSGVDVPGRTHPSVDVRTHGETLVFVDNGHRQGTPAPILHLVRLADRKTKVSGCVYVNAAPEEPPKLESSGVLLINSSWLLNLFSIKIRQQ